MFKHIILQLTVILALISVLYIPFVSLTSYESSQMRHQKKGNY